MLHECIITAHYHTRVQHTSNLLTGKLAYGSTDQLLDRSNDEVICLLLYTAVVIGADVVGRSWRRATMSTVSRKSR